MKNIKAIGFLLLAIVTGLGAAMYAASWASQKSKADATRVVVAASDIEMGSKITPAMLNAVIWPSGSVPPDAFGNTADLQDRVAKVSLLKGEPVIERKLTPKGTQTGLSAVITEGKRAMTVRVNDVIGVAGFALPGTYVDIMVNTQRDGSGGEERRISKTVLEHVLVLAVAQESTRDESKPRVVSAVTLELSLDDAEKLDLARSVGTLSLVLRNQFDKQAVKTAGITKRELFGPAEAPAAKEIIVDKPVMQAARKPDSHAQPPAPTNCIDIFQNGSKLIHCFQ
jgi:pilus assembly protein CpaB